MSIEIREVKCAGDLYCNYGDSIHSDPQTIYVGFIPYLGIVNVAYDPGFNCDRPDIYFGFSLRWEIPYMAATDTNRLLHAIEPLLDRIAEGWDTECDGHYNRGVLTEDAKLADNEITTYIKNYKPEYKVWHTLEWLKDSMDETKEEILNLSDEDLAKYADNLVEIAAGNNQELIDVLGVLTKMRDKLQDDLRIEAEMEACEKEFTLDEWESLLKNSNCLHYSLEEKVLFAFPVEKDHLSVLGDAILKDLPAGCLYLVFARNEFDSSCQIGHGKFHLMKPRIDVLHDFDENESVNVKIIMQELFGVEEGERALTYLKSYLDDWTKGLNKLKLTS